jgi:hypothetical protein
MLGTFEVERPGVHDFRRAPHYDANRRRSERRGMRPDIVELFDRVRSEDGAPLVVCPARPTARDEAGQLWVFRERAPNRLRQLWAGALPGPEIDDLVSRLRERHRVWLGRIETRHPPPSRWFRLVWTLPGAPCRIYTHRGLGIEVEPTGVTRHRFRRRDRLTVPPSSEVEGWISRDWTYAGISLLRRGDEAAEIVRLKSAGLFTQFLLMYDGIDLMLDTDWLDGVVPRVAEVLGVPWKIVDYTDTPPRLVQSATAPAPGPSRE